MDIKKKLRQYADYKGISHRKFSLQIGKSDKFIDTKGSLNSDIFPIIRKTFPDLNINWLLFDEGQMTNSEVLAIEDMGQSVSMSGLNNRLTAIEKYLEQKPASEVKANPTVTDALIDINKTLTQLNKILIDNAMERD